MTKRLSLSLYWGQETEEQELASKAGFQCPFLQDALGTLSPHYRSELLALAGRDEVILGQAISTRANICSFNQVLVRTYCGRRHCSRNWRDRGEDEWAILYPCRAWRQELVKKSKKQIEYTQIVVSATQAHEKNLLVKGGTVAGTAGARGLGQERSRSKHKGNHKKAHGTMRPMSRDPAGKRCGRRRSN